MTEIDLEDYFIDVIDFIDRDNIEIKSGKFYSENLRSFQKSKTIHIFHDYLILINTRYLSVEDRTSLTNEINQFIRILLHVFSEYKIIQKESFPQNCYKIGIKRTM